VRPWLPPRRVVRLLALPVCVAVAIGVGSRAEASASAQGFRLAYGADPTYRSFGPAGLMPPGMAGLSITSIRHPVLGRFVGLDAQMALMLPLEWLVKLHILPYGGLGLLVGGAQRRRGVVGALESVAGLATGVSDWFLVTVEGRWFVMSTGGRKHDFGVWTLSLVVPFE